MHIMYYCNGITVDVQSLTDTLPSSSRKRTLEDTGMSSSHRECDKSDITLGVISPLTFNGEQQCDKLDITLQEVTHSVIPYLSHCRSL